jgi:hypothetical protein
MKITKRLPLALTAAGIVVLLSSCNAMLDFIYPERQIINVTVEVNAVNHPDCILAASYAQVQLLDSTGITLSTLTSSSPTLTGGYAYYTFQFTKLKNQTYGLWSLYYASLTSADWPEPMGTPAFNVENSGQTTSVTLPYNQSSDITNLTVVIQ